MRASAAATRHRHTDVTVLCHFGLGTGGYLNGLPRFRALESKSRHRQAPPRGESGCHNTEYRKSASVASAAPAHLIEPRGRGHFLEDRVSAPRLSPQIFRPFGIAYAPIDLLGETLVSLCDSQHHAFGLGIARALGLDARFPGTIAPTPGGVRVWAMCHRNARVLEDGLPPAGGIPLGEAAGRASG